MNTLEKYAAKQVLIEKLAAWPAIARGAAALGRGAGRLIKSHKDARAIRQAQMGAAKVLKGGYARRAPDISTVSNLIKNPMHPEAQKLIQESVRRASPKTGLVRSTLNLPKNVRSLARAPGDLKKLLRNYPTVTNKHIGTLGGPVNTKAAVMKMKQQLKAGKPAGANIALGKTPLSVRLGPASAQQSQAVRGATRAAAKRDIANVGRGLAIPGAGYGAYKARVK
ncbi:MAG: hypothetical protein CL582_09680 [Alteromonadaceae bacterium]|nr:hypothetical protein [Alteromonadaceae bacterium]|tara:strand:- start:71 stop:742 length:672 start_codon:yes stop_codon:yes gene_type:complete